MTSNDAGKAPCPFRIKHIISEAMPGGRTLAKYTYETCLGYKCPLWRLAQPGDVPRACSGTGTLDECMTAHSITTCEHCPDREGRCGR